MLKDIDVIFFDLQDIGSRYYTFIYTMAYVMQACSEQGKQFVVLDRPNPISGNRIEGNLLKEGFNSFVGLYPLPNRHGLTIGEIALLFNYEFGINCDLTVIPMDGWKRDMYYDETGLFWVPPSPNTTGLDMAVLYPGTCLLEGTNVSEGRGTTKPFEFAGAPFIDGTKLAKRLNEKEIPGVLARPISFVPTYSKYKDNICGGVQLHVVEKREINSFKTGLALLETIFEMYPNDFKFLETAEGKFFFDLLAGTDELRSMILKGNVNTFLEQCEQELEIFNKQAKPYLLYK
jgi:uncharacterized protein YbbC (DUF1343 family)